MLLSEQVRVLRDEENLIDDSTEYSVTENQQTHDDGSTYSTSNTSYTLVKTYTLTPPSGGNIVLTEVGADIKMNLDGKIGYVKITAQEEGGTEENLLEGSHDGDNWVPKNASVFITYRRDKQVTLRWYIKTVETNPGIVYVRNCGCVWVEASWVTVHDYGEINLSEDSIVAFRYTFDATPDGLGSHRLLFGSTPVAGGPFDSSSKTFKGLVPLPAGTYTVKIEGVCFRGTIKVSGLQVGVVCFRDLERSNIAGYASPITISLAQRKLCVGEMNRATLFILVYAYTPDQETHLDNPSESNTNSVKVSVDGVGLSWVERVNDDIDKFYGASFGIATTTLTVDESHTITVTKSNTDTVVYISLILCPWIIPYDAYQPLSLGFPQGSTLYLTLEPLIDDPAKNVKLGKKRAVSLGDSTDYYSTATGTGILSWNYTFETVEVENCVLLVEGYGACISVVGIDVR
ncbi:hypothetical protein J7L06_00580 [Candidatus Bathyarchaeota archaeon]|nr:hypothetical protein [Candidatus Bathyarchaeota archaeon]